MWGARGARVVRLRRRVADGAVRARTMICNIGNAIAAFSGQLIIIISAICRSDINEINYVILLFSIKRW